MRSRLAVIEPDDVESKQKVILQTLTNILELNLGSEYEVREIISSLRSDFYPNEDDQRLEATSQLLLARSKYKSSSQLLKSTKSRLENLRAELDQIELDIAQTNDETEQLKLEIVKESTVFQRDRFVSKELSNLKERFQNILKPVQGEVIDGDCAELIKLNRNLRSELQKLKIEFDTNSSISRRLQFTIKRL